MTVAIGPTEFHPISHLHWNTKKTPVVLTPNGYQGDLGEHQQASRPVLLRWRWRQREVQSTTADLTFTDCMDD